MIDDEVKEWLKKADNDFKLIEHELKLKDEEVVKDVVCFHCQQAVEKYLKAFLIHYKIKYEKTHNIEYLLTECEKVDKDFTNIIVKDITSFAVRIRYPDDFYEPDIKEVKIYYELAKKIRNLVYAKLEIK